MLAVASSVVSLALKDRLHAVTLELGAATAVNQTLSLLNTKLAAAEASPTSWFRAVSGCSVSESCQASKLAGDELCAQLRKVSTLLW